MSLYEPREGYCKKRIFSGGREVSGHACPNRAKKDGWCMVHHPDSVELRSQKSRDRWKRSDEEARERREAREDALESSVQGRIETAVKGANDASAKLVEERIPAIKAICAIGAGDGKEIIEILGLTISAIRRRGAK
jgi:hypothetical protein